MNEPLSMPRLLWRDLIADLRARGAGRRESGAFLLASPASDRIAAHVCYDDLDPSALDTGIIVFHGSGYAHLWQLCEARQLRVVADVHTHPGDWTEQSYADATHPMVGTPGHVALIVPNFARGNSGSLRGVGVYRYLGNHQWQDSTVRNPAFTLSLL
jgi:proteasome lid subunit RPN8/RPN11